MSAVSGSSQWLNEYFTEQDTDQKTIDRQNNDYQESVQFDETELNTQSEADLFPQIDGNSSNSVNL